jgi:hypothetical protein
MLTLCLSRIVSPDPKCAKCRPTSTDDAKHFVGPTMMNGLSIRSRSRVVLRTFIPVLSQPNRVALYTQNGSEANGLCFEARMQNSQSQSSNWRSNSTMVFQLALSAATNSTIERDMMNREMECHNGAEVSARRSSRAVWRTRTNHGNRHIFTGLVTRLPAAARERSRFLCYREATCASHGEYEKLSREDQECAKCRCVFPQQRCAHQVEGVWVCGTWTRCFVTGTSPQVMQFRRLMIPRHRYSDSTLHALMHALTSTLALGQSSQHLSHLCTLTMTRTGRHDVWSTIWFYLYAR